MSSSLNEKLIIGENLDEEIEQPLALDVEEKTKAETKTMKRGNKRRIVEDESSDNEEDNYDWGKRRNYKNKGKSVKKYNRISSDDEEEEEEKVGEKFLWKIVKPKYIYTYKLCQTCSDRLFKDPHKFAHKGNLLRLTIYFCAKCVKLNVAATDLLAGTAIKRRTK